MATNDFYYRARLNVYKRNKYFQWLVLLPVPLVAAGVLIGVYGFVAMMLLVLIAIIFVLVKIDADKNILLFKEESISHVKNDKDAPVAYRYADVVLLHIHNPPRGVHYTLLKFSNGQKFYVTIDRAGGLDAYRDPFYKFLWEKNPGILITHVERYYHYKYFLLADGRVGRVDA